MMGAGLDIAEAAKRVRAGTSHATRLTMLVASQIEGHEDIVTQGPKCEKAQKFEPNGSCSASFFLPRAFPIPSTSLSPAAQPLLSMRVGRNCRSPKR